MAFKGTDAKRCPVRSFGFTSGHEAGYGLIALREQNLVSRLNLLNQVRELSGPDFGRNYHSLILQALSAGSRGAFNRHSPAIQCRRP